MKTYVPLRLYLVIVTVYNWNTVHCEGRVDVRERVGDLNLEFECIFVANMPVPVAVRSKA